jgi:hypothetical protein
MTNLVAAYQDRNVQEAEKILRGELFSAGMLNKLTSSKQSDNHR